MSLVVTTADDVVNQVTTGNDIVMTTNDVVVTTDDVVMTTDDVVMTTYDSSRPSHDLRNRLTTRLVQKSGFYSKLLSSRTSNQFVADPLANPIEAHTEVSTPVESPQCHPVSLV